jgi:hypothetical protein
VGGFLAEDSAFDSVITALENLLLLEVSREPLAAHHLSGLKELATAAYHRACYLIAPLFNTAPEAEASMLESLSALVQAARSLGDGPELQELRADALAVLAATTGGSAAMRGGAVGLLHGDGRCTDANIVWHLCGHLQSARGEGEDGPNFLAGLLKTARSVLWTAPGVLDAVNETLRGWDEDRFVKLLPLLRLALADLTPRETDRVAKRVAALLGTEGLQLPCAPEVDSRQMLRAVELNQQVRRALIADGLEAFCE